MKEPEYIIAIGASAGGLEEINTFFDHTPLDSVSYIVVQHLSADFKSRMVEVLAKHSRLIVEEATNGMTVECNQVYLIPHNKYMTIQNNKLYLRDKEKTKTPHLTINTFFNSLAADCGRRSIGIILSGLGSDGAEGITAIKKAGGMVIARNPETSDFPGMPSKAISTGMVDYILEPVAMPDAIEDFVKYEGALQLEILEDDKNLAAIVNLIKEKSPLDFSDYKASTILRRTKRRAAYHDFVSLGKYLEFLRHEPEELEALSKDFLISVTAFFRDKEAFEFIQKKVLPGILKKLVPGEELKFWIAGCATGEEVYSFAILIAEQLTGDLENTVVKIFATDIDSGALLHAGKGIYQSDVMRNVSSEYLNKYFIKEDGQYRVKPILRKMAIFAKHDLVKNPPYCNMNFISCRNLLIYMAPVLQKKIFTMLLFGLKMDGYLFLGSSENPMPIIQNLETVNKQYKIYKNIKSKRIVSFDAFSMPDSLEIKERLSYVSNADMGSTSVHSLAEQMHVNLAAELGYLVVCIDENMKVVKSYGNTAKYLLPKHFTTDLVSLLPKKLAMVLNTLSNTVIKTNEKASLNGIKIKQGNTLIMVNMSVSPLLVKKKEQQLFMVTFNEDTSFVPSNHELVEFDEKVYHHQYTLNLEEELRELKEKLNLTYEQLDASNENMQSFNEEMISANEEMQSTNEEMQSVNEELDTINSEYQLKNKELMEINDDLNNYFRSNINGQLFINNELLLMKFSPGTVKQINLLETDIGRPLSNITTNIKFETIIDDIKKVITDGTIITKEIETNNGKWYQVMTMPYIQQSDHKHNGAIITFNDITELKSVQKELDISNEMLGMAIHAAEIGTWTLNMQTQEFIPSLSLKEIFGFRADEEMNYEQVVAQILEEYRVLFTAAVDAGLGGGSKCDVEYPLRGFHDDKLRWVRCIGRLSYDHENRPSYFTGVMNDITIHKQDEIRKNDFIALVSHELKTPLTVLQGYAQLLSARALKTEDSFMINVLDKSHLLIRKLSTLISGFLNLSSFESGKIQLVKKSFDLDQLLHESIDDMMQIAADYTILLLPGPSVAINADRDKIGQVIHNFLSNAVKYSPLHKNIEISVKQSDKDAQVAVKDGGIGIALQDQEKLFSRFKRINNAETQHISGFGLGLYLCAEIIQRHGGEVWIESEAGKGSTFYFSVPLLG